MSVTRLGAGGGPRSPYGSFAGKAPQSGKAPGPFTRLSPEGGARILYGDFSGKSPQGPAADQVTRLSPEGGPRILYGDFSGKVPQPIPEVQPGGGGSSRPSRKPADIEYRERIQAIARDDDELTLILTLAMEVLE